jgi:hypothetical protein
MSGGMIHFHVLYLGFQIPISVKEKISLASPNKAGARKGLLCTVQGPRLSDTLLDSSKLLLYLNDIVIATSR